MHKIELISGNKDILENIAIFSRRRPVIQPPKLEMNQLQGNSQEDARGVTGVNQATLLALIGDIQKYAPGQNLNIVIRQVDTLMKFLGENHTPDVEFIAIFSIKSKILGAAQDFLAYQNANDWESIRRVLLQKYEYHRTEETLVAILRRCVHEEGETIGEYHDRI